MQGYVLEDIVRQHGHPLASKFWLTEGDIAANMAEANSVQVNLSGLLRTWAAPKDTYLRNFPVHVMKHFLLAMHRRYPKLVCSGGENRTSCPSIDTFI